ncbi:MAG: nickel-binding protein [Acidobacteriota bacterium]
MTVYAVERQLSGIDAKGLAAAQRAAKEIGERYTLGGRPLRYIRSVFIPGEERSLCLFEAQDGETVLAANREAGLPVDRVFEALDLPSP